MTGTATITEWDLAINQKVSNGITLTVDFDPKSLQLNYTATGAPAAGDTAGAKPGAEATAAGTWNKAAPQQTGQAASLGVDLIFDNSTDGQSVETKTRQLVTLTLPDSLGGQAPSRRVICFSWGSFIFFGYVESMTHTIDFFSATGTPLRAAVHLALTQVNLPPPSGPAPAPGGPGGAAGAAPSFGANAGIGTGTTASISAGAGASAGAALGAAVTAVPGASATLSGGASTGTTPLTFSQAGDTVQAIAARAGPGISWQAIAAANGIDNPRLIPPGTVLDTSAGIGAG